MQGKRMDAGTELRMEATQVTQLQTWHHDRVTAHQKLWFFC